MINEDTAKHEPAQQAAEEVAPEQVAPAATTVETPPVEQVEEIDWTSIAGELGSAELNSETILRTCEGVGLEDIKTEEASIRLLLNAQCAQMKVFARGPKEDLEAAFITHQGTWRALLLALIPSGAKALRHLLAVRWAVLLGFPTYKLSKILMEYPRGKTAKRPTSVKHNRPAIAAGDLVTAANCSLEDVAAIVSGWDTRGWGEGKEPKSIEALAEKAALFRFPENREVISRWLYLYAEKESNPSGILDLTEMRAARTGHRG